MFDFWSSLEFAELELLSPLLTAAPFSPPSNRNRGAGRKDRNSRAVSSFAKVLAPRPPVARSNKS